MCEFNMKKKKIKMKIYFGFNLFVIRCVRTYTLQYRYIKLNVCVCEYVNKKSENVQRVYKF